MDDTSYKAPRGMQVGHVHLRVSDLQRSIAFYRDVLGLEVQQLYGDAAAFLSAGGYHHHLGLNTWESRGGPPPARGTTGLYHVAFLYPDRPALARALAQVLASGVALEGAADHGVSEALYFSDPDGNGIELYRDRAPRDWPRDSDGALKMVNARLDLEALLAET
jgi:catechol 2,3-dioxygenase